MDALRTPKGGDYWANHNGMQYRVVAVANTGNDNPKYPPTVVYFGPNGFHWTKPLSEWYSKMTFIREGE